jgi:hypothetical protein
MANQNLSNVKGNAQTILSGHTRTNAFGADAHKQRTGPGASVTDLPANK